MSNFDIIPKCQGKESEQDLSYQWVQENNELYKMEEGIDIFRFIDQFQNRSPEVQFKVLEHMTQSKIHLNKLYKNPIQFSFNRYPNILPIQYSMVKLNPIEGDKEQEKYINANYINTVVKDYKIIATQGPLSTTVYNFWRMIDQNNIKIIYMLCNLEERNVVKCYKYWPCKNQPKITIQHYQLQLISDQIIQQHLIQKKIRLKGLSNTTNKIITHYHWKQWKDNSAPKNQKIQILEKLLDRAVVSIEKKQQILVHCSAGVGRTGTFIAALNIKLILNFYKQKLFEEEWQQKMKLSIFGIVRRLREQRWGMVFKKEQYEFLYTYAMKQLREIFGLTELQ